MTLIEFRDLLTTLLIKGYNPNAEMLTFCDATDEYESLVPHCITERHGPSFYFGPESQQ